MLFLCLRHCSVDECKNEAYYRECESDQDRCAVALSFCILAGHDHRSEYPGYAECDKHDTVVYTVVFRTELVCCKCRENTHKCAEAETYEADTEDKECLRRIADTGFPYQSQSDYHENQADRQSVDSSEFIGDKSAEHPAGRVA